jgi:chemotaxis protein MotB
MKPEGVIEPEVIIKKVKGHGHGHHGGAWKIAYADFVTAMMAFFMLLWILGATNEQQRKGIADYFTPTVIQMQNSGGSNGMFGGRSVTAPDGTSLRAETTGRRPVTSPGSDSRIRTPGTGEGNDAETNTGMKAGSQTSPRPVDSATKGFTGTAENARGKDNSRARDDKRFEEASRRILQKLLADPTMSGLQGQVKFVRTRDGLRIDLVERADFSMFTLGTSAPTEAAGKLVKTVANAIAETPNHLTVRGHTDALGFSRPGAASNWSLSTARADATRRLLMGAGIPGDRFRRIEGVADTDPFVKDAPLDPRNRRISITLLYEDPA